MAAPNSKQGIIDYAFRRLGAPVIEINVDQEQAEERVDDALQFFSERHFDGVERVYYQYQLTGDDIDNKYIDTNSIGPANGSGGDGPTGRDILSIVRVFPFGDLSTVNMFDVRYQMALTDYFGINRGLGAQSSMGMARFSSTKQYINMIQQIFDPEKSISFSKVTNRLHIEMDWKRDIQSGEYIVIEAFSSLNPEVFNEIYNDRLLKEYVTALVKRQWGINLSKFDGVQLPGGVSLRGGQIYQEALAEIAQIEQRVYSEYELPTDFQVG
tara:strand:- start:18495 stop:19301 length:807 start_codon:yes stop_codon:yes gene_type:complete